jgi:hypothetical protein
LFKPVLDKAVGWLNDRGVESSPYDGNSTEEVTEVGLLAFAAYMYTDVNALLAEIKSLSDLGKIDIEALLGLYKTDDALENAILDFARKSIDSGKVSFTGLIGFIGVALNGSSGSPEFDNPFEDVPEDSWYYDSVLFMYYSGLMLGTSVDPMLFRPDSPTTRAMIVTILYRLAGSPDVSGLPSPFDDVPEGLWYTDAVKWAYENGITVGHGGGRFGPNGLVTNEQLAMFIFNLQQSSGQVPPDILLDYEYPDWDNISDWAKAAVNKLSLQGVFRDFPDEDFNPRAPASRAAVASALYRYLTAVEYE